MKTAIESRKDFILIPSHVFYYFVHKSIDDIALQIFKQEGNFEDAEKYFTVCTEEYDLIHEDSKGQFLFSKSVRYELPLLNTCQICGKEGAALNLIYRIYVHDECAED